MARIGAAELERLKREIRVERLAKAAGVKLVPHGRDLLGLCPFHDDHEPSLVVSPEKNLWHCLGACQAGGTAIDWVMKAKGASFRHAVELLRAELPSLVADEPPAAVTAGRIGRGRHKQLASVASTEANDAELLERVVSYYHQTLLESPEAQAYLEKRGLNDPELVKEFRLGFANRTLAYCRWPSESVET